MTELRLVLVGRPGPGLSCLALDSLGRTAATLLAEQPHRLDPDGGLCATFASLAAALRDVCGWLEEMALLEAAFGSQLDYRLALHLGDVRQDDPLTGPAVDFALGLLEQARPGQVLLGASVVTQVASRPTPLVIDDGHARLAPERRRELLATGQAGHAPRFVLGWAGSKLEPERRLFEWTRSQGGEVLVWDQRARLALLPPRAPVAEVLPWLEGLRAVLGVGELVHQSAGLVVEEVLEGLFESGLEPEVVLVTQAAARLLTEVSLEPFGPSGGPLGLPLYRCCQSPGPLRASHRPRRISLPGPVDVVVGVEAGAPGSLEQRLSQFEPAFAEHRLVRSANCPDQPELGVALAGLASLRDVPLPPQLVEGGDLSQLAQLAAGLGGDEPEARLRGRLTVVVAGPLGGEDPFGDQEWPLAAQSLEDQQGRAALLSSYQRWCEDLSRPDWLGWLESAELVISLFPDPRLQQLERPRVIGLADDPLLLTEVDSDQWLAGLPQRLASVADQLVGQPCLLLGQAGSLAPLKAFFRQFRLLFGEVDMLATLPSQEARWWQRRGVEVVGESPPELVVRLGPPRRSSRSRGPARVLATPDRPYKFLSYFEAQDRAIFFGREDEVVELSRRVLREPLLVLFGRSGVGKTSLLRAGVLVELGPPRDFTLYLRPLGDPLRVLLEQLGAPGESLAAAMASAAARLSGHLTVVFDQFEEFFVHCRPDIRARFVAEVAAFVEAAPPRAHLVFSMREDFLAEMSEFEERLPTILENRFRVRALEREQARQAMVGPARLFGLEWQPELVELLLDKIDDDGVDPPELQIVCDRLFEARQGASIDMAVYQQLGGLRAILVGYLETTLATLGGDVEAGRRLLKAMVTSRGTKAVLGLSELAQRLEQDPGQVSGLLDRLVQARLVRALSEQGQASFELAHEYIIEEVVGWTSAGELALLHARQVLESEALAWQRDRSLIPSDRLALVKPHLQVLEPGPQAQAMLVRAAALHHQDLTDWILEPAAAIPALLELLAEPDTAQPVGRRLLAGLYGLALSELESEAMLVSALRFGTPDFLKSLDRSRQPRLYEQLSLKVLERYFGPERMVCVPAGPAWLGSSAQNKAERKSRLRPDLHERIDTEADYRQVDLPQFWIDRYPVTHLEYTEFEPNHTHYYAPKEARHPVVFVSYHQAQAYAAWLGKCLPSEEQWEKAARGQDGRLYPWGNQFESSRLNSAESERRHTTPVDAHPGGASPYGCLDMSGNIWEWTCTPWDESGPFMAKKGGCAINFEPHMQSSARFEDLPDIILKFVGFRAIVLDSPWPRREVDWF
ncbi:MAG: SUMF1/EgtB/PvdO family nonheme iron enzyme [Candidatus Eremiobacteraeota bacterium]|nr:SUMF1/EgtB/PvdO family nonheme iron enzyme [Candidatus Eremiobacteraeota bacterium]